MTKRTFCGSSNDHETADILNLTTFRWPGSTDAERNQGKPSSSVSKGRIVVLGRLGYNMGFKTIQLDDAYPVLFHGKAATITQPSRIIGKPMAILL